MRGSARPLEALWETEPGTEVGVEDEDVDVVIGVDEQVPGYEFEGFTLSEIFRRKRLSKENLSRGFVDTAHFPQCEFSSFQQIPFTFLLEIVWWPIIEFCQTSCAAHDKT